MSEINQPYKLRLIIESRDEEIQELNDEIKLLKKKIEVAEISLPKGWNWDEELKGM